jgi:transposase-like protein
MQKEFGLSAKYKYSDGSTGQHILKSAKARDFTLYDATRFTEEEAFWFLVEQRWGGQESVICPSCGTVGKHYYRKGRHQWRCKDCDSYFSLTTGTPFQDRKIQFSKILMGMMEFTHDANGVSHHELARKLDIQVKTAQSFVGRLRESLWNVRPKFQLSGVVQMDGGHFGGRPRHGRIRKKSGKEISNHVEDMLRKNKDRKPRSRTGIANWKRRVKNRRIVMVLRELHPEPGMGAKTTIVAICGSEAEAQATTLATTYIAPGSLIMTDENAAYNSLDRCIDHGFTHESVKHEFEFSTIDGVNDNQAESYFSRLRRYVLGVAHRIEAKYMMDISIEMAWREDVRKMTEGTKFKHLLSAVFSSGLSKWWRGYWQGFHRPGEIRWDQSPA